MRDLGSRGCGFESRHSDHNYVLRYCRFGFILEIGDNPERMVINMATEIINGRLHIDGKSVPLSMDEARAQKGSIETKSPSYTQEERAAVEDVFGRMMQAQAMGMDVLMPSDEEFRSLNQDAYADVVREAAEQKAKRSERVAMAERVSDGVDDVKDSSLAEYGIY